MIVSSPDEMHNVNRSCTVALQLLDLEKLVGTCKRVHALKLALALGGVMILPEDRRVDEDEDATGPVRRQVSPDFPNRSTKAIVTHKMLADDPMACFAKEVHYSKLLTDCVQKEVFVTATVTKSWMKKSQAD